MSTSTSTGVPIVHIPAAPEGIVRLFVPDGFTASKRELRNAAAKVAGTIDVGRTPAGKGATLKGVKGTGFDFSPVVKGSTAADPVDVDQAADDVTDPRVAALAALGLSAAQIAAALAVTPAAPASKGKGKGKGATVKTPREVPAFLRKWEGVTCKTCRDFGKVSSIKRPDGSPKPFRTQHGADTAPTGIPCPTHVKVTATARRSRTA
jgi:hypothetical protein